MNRRILAVGLIAGAAAVAYAQTATRQPSDRELRQRTGFENVLSAAYILGYDTEFFIDQFRLWTSDPGW